MPDLGIETAADDASVAVLDGERVLAERSWHIDTTTSQELLAQITAVLQDAGVAREALTSVAVDVGPGGYGSLRTGVATAQGIALGLSVPLAGVVRLEVDAFPHLVPGDAVVAVHDAGRAGVAWAAYGACELLESGQVAPPEVLVAPRLQSLEECVQLAPSPARWCGEITDALRLARDASSRGGDTDSDEAARSAVDVVRLARLHRAYGDPAAVDVIYLRPPAIGARAR
jgi:tRNA threonylcarbamoyl adenosine modification protein YeaZ